MSVTLYSSFLPKFIVPWLFIFASSNTLAQRPNILYIMTDDMGYGDLGCYGQKDFATPNIDRLASQGMLFTQAYAAAPICTPTRTGFLTGRYPARTPVGLKEPLTPKDSAFGLDPSSPSFVTLMKEAGYETALVGKWHLGVLPSHSPNANGFDYFYGIRTGAADYISHKAYGGKIDLFENENPVLQEGYLTDLFTQKAVFFLKQPHTKPFFLSLQYNAPHWPWQGPGDKPYADTIDLREGGSPAVYAAMMKSLDEGIGAVLASLDESGLTDKTIVIFTNDNGGERYSNQGGLAKQKGTLWEGGIKVPAFVRWPGKIKESTITQQAVITMDWTATILSAAGAKPRADFPLDGIDLMPICQGASTAVARTFYWRSFQRTKQKAIREGDWKYLQDEGEEFLFNLAADPAEKTNLRTKNTAIFNRLKARFAEWEKTVLTPIPL